MGVQWNPQGFQHTRSVTQRQAKSINDHPGSIEDVKNGLCEAVTDHNVADLQGDNHTDTSIIGWLGSLFGSNRTPGVYGSTTGSTVDVVDTEVEQTGDPT